MIAVWPDDNNPIDYYYEFTKDQGNLIYKLLGKISVKQYVEWGFSDDEIEKLTSIYYSF